jgi:hypothetical protein
MPLPVHIIDLLRRALPYVEAAGSTAVYELTDYAGQEKLIRDIKAATAPNVSHVKVSTRTIDDPEMGMLYGIATHGLDCAVCCREVDRAWQWWETESGGRWIVEVRCHGAIDHVTFDQRPRAAALIFFAPEHAPTTEPALGRITPLPKVP